ncbi:MAG: glycosyltransferase family 4 protein [Acidiphilium sp.]|nr:glycosyltransferase family 4 protein [Acidiphilium sp.]MDD4934562.1 glycosyltransferase family 4 protein [Acidiphilium sp.]
MQRAPRLAMMTLPTLDHFTADILARLPAASGWEVKKFTVSGPAVLEAALAWTDDPSRDALWFEFCWPPFPAMIGTTDFGGRRVIVRVHRIEATETPHVANTAWAKVDDVIVVSPDMRERVLAAAPEIPFTSRLHLVLNGVDTERFKAAKTWNRYRVGWCGLMTLRKNPTLALQVLAKLRSRDPRFHLSLCGMGGEALAHESFMHLAKRLNLQDAICWEGRISQADIPAWHAENGVLLHTSLHESFGYAIAEAALSGCDISVFDHPGAAAIWPQSILFGTVDEAAAMICAAQPKRWREYVCDNFSLNRQIATVSTLLNECPPHLICKWSLTM